MSVTTALRIQPSGKALGADVTWDAPRTLHPPVVHEHVVDDRDAVIGPDGEVLAVSDKQVLMGSERDHLDPATERSTVLHTPFGRVGLYSCMDGVINETPRMLAVEGAQLLLNSLNSFALDEASLHIPVRAVENRVWVVAANKVGPLVPERSIAAVAERVGVAPLLDRNVSSLSAGEATLVAIAAAIYVATFMLLALLSIQNYDV